MGEPFADGPCKRGEQPLGCRCRWSWPSVGVKLELYSAKRMTGQHAGWRVAVAGAYSAKERKKNRTDLCVREEKGKGPAACGPSVSGLGRWSWQLGLLVGQMEKT